MADQSNPFSDPSFGATPDTKSNPFSNPEFGKPASAIRKLGDLGLSVAKGVIAVPETAVGLANLATGGYAGKLVEGAGVRFKDAKDVLSGFQSDELQSKQKDFQQADGIISKAGVALSNPSLLANVVSESVPAMLAGGAVSKGLMYAAPKLGALASGFVGEGIIGAGSAGEQIRQESADGLLSAKQAALAGATGLTTGLFGAAGGKVAQKLGIGDIDTMMANGTTNVLAGAKPKGMFRRGAEGALSEGFLEELPQSVSEQALQNIALDKDVTTGLEDAAVMGTLAGNVMGGGAGLLSNPQAKQTPPPVAPPAIDQLGGGLPPTPPVAPLDMGSAVGYGGTPPVAPSVTPEQLAGTTNVGLQQMVANLSGPVLRNGQPTTDIDRADAAAAQEELNRRAPTQQQQTAATILAATPEGQSPGIISRAAITALEVQEASQRAVQPDQNIAQSARNNQDIHQVQPEYEAGKASQAAGGRVVTLDKSPASYATDQVPIEAAFAQSDASQSEPAFANVPTEQNRPGAAPNINSLPQNTWSNQNLQDQKQRPFKNSNKSDEKSDDFRQSKLSEEDKRAILFSNQAVVDGGIQFEGTQDGDVLNGMGAPFKTKMAALRRATMEGKDWSIAPVFDGFVARRKDAMPGETNTPTESVGGNIATLAETENPLNQPLASESISPVATENVASNVLDLTKRIDDRVKDTAMEKAVRQELDSQLAEMVALEKQKRVTYGDLAELENITYSNDNGYNASRQLHALLKTIKQRPSADIESAGQSVIRTQDAAANDSEPAPVTQPAQAPKAETGISVSGNPAPVTQPAQPVTGEGAGASQPTQVAAKPADDRVGRDNTPMSEGGKPFKTKRAAMNAKKLQPAMRIAQTEGGYVLKPKTEKQLAAEVKAAKRLGVARAGQAGVPTAAHEFIATEGGMDPSTRNEFSMGDNPRVGNRRLFAGARGGMSLEAATEKLIEAGYLPQGASHSDAVALIGRSFTNPQYTATGTETAAEAEIEARFDDYLAEQEDAAQNDDFDPFESAADLDFTISDAEMAGYDAAEDPIKLEVNALLAQADALGIDTSEITEQAYEDTRNGSEQDYYEAARAALAAAVTTSNRDSSQDAGQQGNAGEQAEVLTAPTRADVLAQQERTDNAQALDDRAQIDAEASRQTLTRQNAPEQRRDTSVDMFGEEKAVLESAKKDADAAAKNEAAKDPNQTGMFDAPAEPQAQATSTEAKKPANSTDYATDFAIRPVEIIESLMDSGAIKALYKAAGVKTANAFGDLPMESQSNAYAKFVSDGGTPAPAPTESYGDKVARMEREIVVRRLQSDQNVNQANGKPFKTEASAKQFSAEFDLDDTHKVSPSGTGYTLQRLGEGQRPSVLKAIADRRASDPEEIRQNAAWAKAEAIGATADAAVLAYGNGETSIAEFESALSGLSITPAPKPEAKAETAPAWHTKLPETGVAFKLGDEKLNSSRDVIARIAQQAADAITQVQNMNGGKMYAYVLPSTDTEHGAMRLFPDDQKPPAPWKLATGEGLPFGFMTGEQLTSKLREILQSQPILTSGDEKAMAAALTNPPKAKPATPTQPAPIKVGDTLRKDGFDYTVVDVSGNIVDAERTTSRNGGSSTKIGIAMTAMDAMEARDAAKEPAAESKPATEATKPASIEDFGEKLLGARKDYATLMSDAESLDISAEPLSKSWPEPDYQKLLDAGTPKRVVALVRSMRDEIPTKPQKSWKLKSWASQVELLRGMTNRILNGDITKETLDAKLNSDEYRSLQAEIGGRADLYEAVGHEKSLKGITFKQHLYSLYKGERNVIKWVIEQQVKATAMSNWPREIVASETREQALKDFVAKYETLDSGKAKAKAGLILYGKRGEKGTWIGKKIGREYIDLKKFDEVKEARAYMESNSADLEKMLAQYKNTPYERNEDNAPRVGGDHRNGAPVTPEVFGETFGFRGVQFGNYVEQGRRQSDLNEAYDALMDMAAVLGIPPKAISLNGRLGLAFGARGKGGKNAPAAHYEPGLVVINLTKGGGPGSLAHEWFHSMDNYFAKEGGVSTVADGNYMTGGARGDALRVEMRGAFTAIKRAIMAGALKIRSQELDKRRTSAYWSTPVEMAARSFESYIIAKLQDQSASNDYLANVVSQKAWDVSDAIRLGNMTEQAPVASYPYPTADEMPAVRAAFDDFFKTVQTKETEQGVAMFSRGESDSSPEKNALQALSDNDELFSLPKSTGETIEGIAADTDPSITVKKLNHPGLVSTYVLTMPDGGRARLMVRKVNPYGPQSYGMNAREDGEASDPILERPGSNAESVPDDTENVYIDVSALKEGGQGARIYSIAATFAHNTGRILIGDPAGLSDVAMRRRTEHMLASALKFGTTRHLAPHPRQVDGASGIGVPHLNWTYGDDLGNIKSLIQTSLKSLDNAGPQLLTFDPQTGTFRDSEGGAVDDRSIRQIVESGRRPAGRAGVATYKRNAVLRSLVREEGAEGGTGGQGAGILAQLVAVGSQFPASSKRIFYSRGSSDSGLDTAEVTSIVDAIRARWGNAPEIIIAADMSDPLMPQKVRDQDQMQKSQGATGEPEGFVYRGKVYLLASELATPTAVMRVLFHESLGHLGLRGVFGDKLKPILDQITAMRRADVIKKARQYGLVRSDANGDPVVDVETATDKEVFAAMDQGHKREAAEEVLAVMAQDKPELGYVQRAIGLIRGWLRANVPGFSNMKMTDAEIITNFILPARRFVEGKGGPTGGMKAPASVNIDTQPAMSRGESAQSETKFQSSAGKSWKFDRFAAAGREAGSPQVAMADAVALTGIDLGLSVEVSQELGEDVPMAFDHASDTVLVNARFANSPRGEMAQWMAEEILHALDSIRPNRMLSASATSFDLNSGVVSVEATRHFSEGGKLANWLTYPLADDTMTQSQVKAELFARLGVIYFGQPELLKREFPTAYKAYHDTFGLGTIERAQQKDTARDLSAKVFRASGAIDNPKTGGQYGQRAGTGKPGKRSGEARSSDPRLERLYSGLRRNFGASAGGGLVQFARSNTTAAENKTQVAPDIRFSRSLGATLTDAATPGRHSWDAPEASQFDDLVYKLQDKQIDTKRVVDAIKAKAGALADEKNVYLQEELFHGRAAARTEDFVNKELAPLINMMKMRGIDIPMLDEYLHARHAEEANKLIAERNKLPNAGQLDINGNVIESPLQDGGSGMTTQAARDYLAKLTPAERTKLDAVAAKVDAILGTTRQLYADYDLESQDKVDGWGTMFKHYVPLMREDKDGGMGIGQGFSIKGKEVKGRTGSTRKVVDILANIALQREKAIVRGEKNRVATALVGLVKLNPNKEFWHVGPPPATKVYDPASNSVVERQDPMYKSRDNVVVAKIKGKDGFVTEQAVTFSEDDPRAVRMAAALKNLDATQLEGLLGVSAKITRYFAAINTQYNPIFGTVNLVRDIQGALFNLTSTPLKGNALAIAGHTMSALKGIYMDARAARDGKTPTSKWAALWEEFQDEGGQTGFRDLFANSADRAKAIERELNPTAWMDSPLGNVFTANGTLKVPLAVAQKKATGMFDWLSDYNLAMENAVRLAAYKVALEQGISKQQAASLGKNLTVNFNRKGQVGQQAGALYAFFNASMQGTARLGQTLFDMEPGKPKTIRMSATGKKIIYGGILLGAMQALLLAAAGFDDEEPPDFVRERSLIIPTGGKTYITIPMPLGLHVLPNMGRIPMEFAMGGFKDPIQTSAKLIGLFANSFNPIGGGASLVQMLAPTAIDPLVAIAENKDWTGKPIAKESFNKATPGHMLAKDTATAPAKFLSEAINFMSGGTEYTAGVLSPTPDQIDYLFGQATGGVGREASKLQQSGSAMFSGEDLPIYKVPLVGRFYGDTDTQSAQSGKFYSAINKLNVHEAEIKGLRKNGKGAEAAAYIQENPESRLFVAANFAEREVQKLRAAKRDLIAKDAPADAVKALETRINERMTRFNQAVQRLREQEAA